MTDKKIFLHEKRINADFELDQSDIRKITTVGDNLLVTTVDNKKLLCGFIAYFSCH